VKQPAARLALFTDAKIPENDVKHVLDVDPTGQPAQRPAGQPQFLRHHVLADRQRLGEGAIERCERILKGVSVPRAGHQRGLGGTEELLRVNSQRRQKFSESRFS
jgi:hypothetical protein